MRLLIQVNCTGSVRNKYKLQTYAVGEYGLFISDSDKLSTAGVWGSLNLNLKNTLY